MLIKDGKPSTYPQEMADHLNQNYIVSSAKTLRSISKDRGDPMRNFMKLIGDTKLNLVLQPIRKFELRDIIQAINQSKSSARD